MMSLNAVTVPIGVLPAVAPLAAGYLQSDACFDPEITESCEFEASSCTTTVDFEEMCSELEAKNAGIYALRIIPTLELPKFPDDYVTTTGSNLG